MKSLSSFGAMATELLAIDLGMAAALNRGLDRVAVKIENTAKSELGVYQDEVGPFPAWEPLADATMERREALGFTPNDPLLMSGELKASIEHNTEGFVAWIGTNAEQAEFLEFGTSRMPARPFMGPAAFRNKAAIQAIIGAAAVSAFVGGTQVHRALEYDFRTAT